MHNDAPSIPCKLLKPVPSSFAQQCGTCGNGSAPFHRPRFERRRGKMHSYPFRITKRNAVRQCIISPATAAKIKGPATKGPIRSEIRGTKELPEARARALRSHYIFVVIERQSRAPPFRERASIVYVTTITTRVIARPRLGRKKGNAAG